MKVNEFIESLNLEKGKDSRYYIDWLKEKGIKISDKNNIVLKAARCHSAEYGKIQSSSLLQLAIKYNLNIKQTCEDVQKQIAKIYFSELEKALQENSNCIK